MKRGRLMKKMHTKVLHKEEAGVYVICSDEALLENINKLLRRKGVISIADAAGRMHYMIDARDDKGKATDKVNALVVPDRTNLLICERTIEEVLIGHGIDIGLTGGMILFFIVRWLILEGEGFHSNTKMLYNIASEAFNMSYSSIERDVRYTISKSSYPKGLRSIRIIKELTEETRRLIGERA